MQRITKAPEVRRQEILDTAIRLFYENGYEKTSITDIANAMHVAQGLCYRYFPSKEAVFDAAVDQYAELLAGRYAAVLKRTDLTLEQIILQMPGFMEVETDDTFSYKLCHGSDSMKTHYQLSICICRKLLPFVTDLLLRAKEKGEIHLNDPETAASFCLYGQLGILLQTDLPGEERISRIRAFLLEFLQLEQKKR